MKRRRTRRILLTMLFLFFLCGDAVLIWHFLSQKYGQTERIEAEHSVNPETDQETAMEGSDVGTEAITPAVDENARMAEELSTYYYRQLDESGQEAYRELLTGIMVRQEEIKLSIADDDVVNRVYHALLMEHPELFWVHNREKVYKTTYFGRNGCTFTPGYAYTDEEMSAIKASMETAYQEVTTLIPQGADDYEKVKTVYTYVIDLTEYVASDDDQSIAGTFWKKQAVCAGYAGAVQYLLNRLGIPNMYVEGETVGSDEGHAWNIVFLDGEYYYVDATNGDQPTFLEGAAVEYVEHKTTIYDYLCPFPDEYEMTYIPSDQFEIPDCVSTEKNFYVLNQGCFDSYDSQTLLNYCKMRLDNGAAVVRFKFSSQEAFERAKNEWVSGEEIQEVARYYMDLNGLQQIQYYYGILENMKTMYYMF